MIVMAEARYQGAARAWIAELFRDPLVADIAKAVPFDIALMDDEASVVEAFKFPSTSR